METTLHRQLKAIYSDSPSNTEVTLGPFRIDVVRNDELIEIQCASLSAISRKAHRLLEHHPLRIVKPIIHRTRIKRLDEPDGAVISRRLSPKRGSLIDLFDELIYLTRVFPHPNLVIEVPVIDVEQTRIPPPARRRRRRWQKDFAVHDVTLETIHSRHEFREPADLLRLVKVKAGATEISTSAIAQAASCPRWTAQKIAYVLRHVGAIQATGRTRRGILYAAA